MKKNKKTLSIIAAAILAVSPVAAGVISLPNISTVKADTQLSSDQLMAPYYNQASEYDALIIKLTKANPYLTAYAGDTVHQLSKRRITDISSNYGHVTKRDGDIYIFKTFSTGDPDFGSKLKPDDKLQQGQNYVAAISFLVNGTNIENSEIVGVSYDDSWQEMLTYDFDDDSSVTLLVPVKVEPAQAKPVTKQAPKTARKTSTKRAYVKVRRGHKVRTYTSRGRYSKHYVYGHHTYKVTSKKHIKRHGYCWKLSGKNQYVPAKYIKVR